MARFTLAIGSVIFLGMAGSPSAAADAELAISQPAPPGVEGQRVGLHASPEDLVPEEAGQETPTSVTVAGGALSTTSRGGDTRGASLPALKIGSAAGRVSGGLADGRRLASGEPAGAAASTDDTLDSSRGSRCPLAIASPCASPPMGPVDDLLDDVGGLLGFGGGFLDFRDAPICRQGTNGDEGSGICEVPIVCSLDERWQCEPTGALGNPQNTWGYGTQLVWAVGQAFEGVWDDLWDRRPSASETWTAADRHGLEPGAGDAWAGLAAAIGTEPSLSLELADLDLPHLPAVTLDVAAVAVSATLELVEHPAASPQAGGRAATAPTNGAPENGHAFVALGPAASAGLVGGDRATPHLALSDALGRVQLTSAPAPPGTVATEERPLFVLFASLAVLLPLLLLYHRLRRREALAQQQRRRIHGFITADPGLTISALRDATGLHYTTCQHHVRILCHLGLVETVRVGGSIHCFPDHGKFGAVEKRLLAAGRTAKSRELVRFLLRDPGSSLTATARALGIVPPSLKHHTDRLSGVGLLELRREGRRVRLFLAPSAVDAAARVAWDAWGPAPGRAGEPAT